MFSFLHYGFVIRGLEAGIIIALTAPLIGIFLVLRRYSLIADTLSHVSFAGVALGILLGLNPVVTAIGASAISSVAIERLRNSRRIYGESALSLFLSGSLAIAIVLISAYHGFNVNLSNYLFGSIVTVKQMDVVTIFFTCLVVAVLIFAFFKELVFISFDEEAAQVSGIPIRLINTIFILLAAVVIALSIPIIGILLISALIVIPVLTALQFRQSFKKSIVIAEVFSLLSVILGVIVAYYLNISTGGTIVLIALLFFVLSLVINEKA